jgi:hypothetical protein
LASISVHVTMLPDESTGIVWGTFSSKAMSLCAGNAGNFMVKSSRVMCEQ